MAFVVQTGNHCFSCGECVATCPTVFHACRWTGMVEVIASAFDGVEEEVVTAAISCPAGNIRVERDGVLVEQAYMTVPVVAIERLCADVVELVVGTDLTGFLPGQYITFGLSDRKGKFSRAYSIVSCEQGHVAFCIKLDPKGRAGNVFSRLKVGDKVKITAPKGKFALLPDAGKAPDRPRTFVATGTGIAPILSMLKAIPDVPKRVLFGVRHEHELFYTERLAEVPNTTVHVTVSRPEPSWQGLRGRVTEHLHGLDLAPDEEVYLCGSANMVAEVTTTLASRGHSPDMIVAESFSLSMAASSAESAAQSKVQAFGLFARRVHFYASIPVMLLLLFYAVTGFIGSRADLFVSQAAEAGGEGSTGEALALPGELPLTVAGVVPWFAARYGGDFDLGVAEEDEEVILCDGESVWGTHSFTVDKPSRTYQVESRRAPWATALVNLHRGKHSGWSQKVLADLAAITLVLVTLTGVAMVALARAKLRQRVVIGVLSGMSVLFLVLFLMNR